MPGRRKIVEQLSACKTLIGSWLGYPWSVSNEPRYASTDTVITAAVYLLTPPLRQLYAVLMRAGILTVEE